MKDYKLDFQSELPVEFANEFKVELPAKTRTVFTINHDMVLQEFEDDTVICVTRDDEFLISTQIENSTRQFQLEARKWLFLLRNNFPFSCL
ncbi:MAG: hypothetical protein ACLTPR_07710 [Enterococcus canintestini]|uniref:hypothetical protein n=1 Tax=Enterococcus canintestini TaxID=317010 RepID=UPI003991004F